MLRAQIFICNRFHVTFAFPSEAYWFNILTAGFSDRDGKFDKFVHTIQMERCLAINQPQCLFAHLSAHSKDAKVASERKMKAARITHPSSKIDTRSISGADYLQFCFWNGICIDLVTDFSWKSKELGRRTGDIAMSQFFGGLASISKREKTGTYLCNRHCF